MRKDIYQTITDQIVIELEKGVRPWLKPSNTDHLEGRAVLPLRHNGIAYRGVNIVALWMQGLAKGFLSATWMSYRQAQQLGGQVRKGEKGSLVVYANKLTRPDTDAATGEEITRDIHYLKGYTVFNCEQIEGLPAHYYEKPAPVAASVERIERAESFFAATGATVIHGGTQARYVQGDDRIHMPCIDLFRDAASYYGTLAHETVHFTKHPTRLNREFGRKRWGDEGYAMEELVAELGAAFLSADLALTPQLRDEHASYLDHWLKVLKRDNRAIFTAAAHAQRAADFLHGLQSDNPNEVAA